MDIEITKYEAKVVNGQIRHFAIPKDKKKDPIEMPAEFAKMYDEEHLKVRQISAEEGELFPDMFGIQGDTYYIPLWTSWRPSA